MSGKRSTAKISKTFEVGSVVRVQLDPTVGAEKRKERFCVVVEDGGTHLDLVIVLPITEDNGHRISQLYISITELEEAGLHKPSVIDCYQIRTVSTQRLKRNKEGSLTWGRISAQTLFDMRVRLARILDIGEEHILE
jgi:mRNA-degrading endonuclease toxin of MazEF toxin-antitoxin module